MGSTHRSANLAENSLPSKIRKENKGRVQDTATKFSTSSSTSSTPARPSRETTGRTSRRQSARLGVGGTPARFGAGGYNGAPAAHRLGVPSPMRTPLGLPLGRRSTLTGIRTAALRGYAAHTIASSALVSEKSPHSETLSSTQEKLRKSPMMTAPKAKRSPKAPVYENLRVEKSLNPNDIKARPLERKVSKEKFKRHKANH